MKPAKIRCELVSVYGLVMSERKLQKWSRLLNSGRTNVHNEFRSGHPCHINEDLKANIDNHIKVNRRFTVREISDHFPMI